MCRRIVLNFRTFVLNILFLIHVHVNICSCWLEIDSGLIWSFIGPAAAIILVSSLFKTLMFLNALAYRPFLCNTILFLLISFLKVCYSFMHFNMILICSVLRLCTLNRMCFARSFVYMQYNKVKVQIYKLRIVS